MDTRLVWWTDLRIAFAGASTPRRPVRCRRRGQALIEYSIIQWLLIVALVIGSTVRMIPTAQGRKSMLDLFLTAFQSHYDSLYFLLNSPFP